MTVKKIFVQLEVDYYTNDKFGTVSAEGERLFLRALCLAKDRLTDGHLSRRLLGFLCLGEIEAAAAELVDAGLWAGADGGWQITGFLKRNKSADEIADATSQKRTAARDRQRECRHSKHDQKPVDADADDDATALGSLARSEVDLWNVDFPQTTKGLRDELLDQNAFRRLTNDEGKTPEDFAAWRAYLKRSGDIEYWPRPAKLVRPTDQGNGQEAWAVIENRIIKEQQGGNTVANTPTEIYRDAWEQ